MAAIEHEYSYCLETEDSDDIEYLEPIAKASNKPWDFDPERKVESGIYRVEFQKKSATFVHMVAISTFTKKRTLHTWS